MNDNKSTMMNNAAVQQLRKVPGFDPMKLLRKTISVKTGHPVWKLDLRYKRLWFRLACPNGRMLLKPLRISDQLAIIEAQVYFSKDDPVPAASFTSEQRRENVPGGEFLRAAQEDALNMALENAGFGIQFCDVSCDYGGELFGSEVPIQTEAAEAAAEEIEVPSTPLRRKLPQKHRRRWIWILCPLNSLSWKQRLLLWKKRLTFMSCRPSRKKLRKSLQNSRRPRPIRQIWMSVRSRSVWRWTKPRPLWCRSAPAAAGRSNRSRSVARQA